MKKDKSNSNRNAELRKIAEEVLGSKKIALEEMPNADVKDLVHELQVHQIELEMQNEDLRKAWILIEESRSEYTGLYDFAPVGYLTFNINRQIVKANLTIAGMLGEDKINLNNKTFYRHIVKQDCDIFHLHHQEVFKKKAEGRCELRLKRRDGVLFYAQLNSIYVKNSEGNGFCRTSITDITEQKKAEKEIRLLSCAVDRQNKDLKIRNELLELEINEHIKTKEKLMVSSQLMQSEKMKALGIMAAGVAHEMNNNLMGLINSVQYSIKHTSIDDKRYEVLKEAEQIINRCIEIVNCLLGFSYMDVEAEKNCQRVNCTEIFKQVFRLLAYRIEKEQVIIMKNYCDKQPDVFVNVSNIQQVFFNLIINSLDALEHQQKKEIRITVKRNGKFIEILISDTGCGIAGEYQKKIFDPFFTTKPVGKGTGIGLSTSYSVIRNHEGEIKLVSSKPDEGTEFKILLPSCG